jgi:hypothetical protein
LKIATVDTTGTGTGTGTGITVRDQWFLLSESGIVSFPDGAALMDSIGSLSPSELVKVGVDRSRAGESVDRLFIDDAGQDFGPGLGMLETDDSRSMKTVQILYRQAAPR